MDTQEPDNSLAAFIGIKPEPAGFWIRLGAFMIDLVCLWGIYYLFLFIPIRTFSDRFNADLLMHITFLLMFLISSAYHTLTIGKWGCGLGKFAAGIGVLTRDGGEVSYTTAFGRALARHLSTLTLCIGYVISIFSKQRKTLHDHISGTRVVYKQQIGPAHKTAIILAGIVLSFIVIRGFLLLTSVPNTFGTVEKARVAEAMSVISNIKSAEERLLSRSGSYTRDFTNLDISYTGMTANIIPTKFYTVSISTAGCGEQPCYIVTATRHNNKGTVAARYGLYSLNAIIPDRPTVRIASCPGGGSNCAELLY